MNWTLIFIWAIIGGTIWATTKVIVGYLFHRHSQILQAEKRRLEMQVSKESLNNKQVSILSDKASSHIIKLIEDYQSSTAEGIHNFLTDAIELLEKLEQRTKTTV